MSPIVRPFEPPQPSPTLEPTDVVVPVTREHGRGTLNGGVGGDDAAGRIMPGDGEEDSVAPLRKKPRLDEERPTAQQQQKQPYHHQQQQQARPSSSAGIGSFFPLSDSNGTLAPRSSSYRTTSSSGANSPAQPPHPGPPQHSSAESSTASLSSYPSGPHSPPASYRSDCPSPFTQFDLTASSSRPAESLFRSARHRPPPRLHPSQLAPPPVLPPLSGYSPPSSSADCNVPPGALWQHHPSFASHMTLRHPSQSASVSTCPTSASSAVAPAVASPNSELSPASSPGHTHATAEQPQERGDDGEEEEEEREATHRDPDRRASGESERSTGAKSTGGVGGGGGGGGKTAFIGKLYHMLTKDPALKKLISWTQGGETFFVSNPDEFAATACPLHFKHHNWQSFVRQLNMYGFSKVTAEERDASIPDSGGWEFRHPYFIEGQVDLLQNIKRKTVKSDSKRGRIASSTSLLSSAPVPYSSGSSGVNSGSRRKISASSSSSSHPPLASPLGPPPNLSILSSAGPSSRPIPSPNYNHHHPYQQSDLSSHHPHQIQSPAPPYPYHAAPASRPSSSLGYFPPIPSASAQTAFAPLHRPLQPPPSSLAPFPQPAPSSLHAFPQDLRNRVGNGRNALSAQHSSSLPITPRIASPFAQDDPNLPLPHRQQHHENVLPPISHPRPPFRQNDRSSTGSSSQSSSSSTHNILNSLLASTTRSLSKTPPTPGVDRGPDIFAAMEARVSTLEAQLVNERMEGLTGQIVRAEDLLGRLEEVDTTESAVSKQRMLDSIQRIVHGHRAQAQAARASASSFILPPQFSHLQSAGGPPKPDEHPRPSDLNSVPTTSANPSSFSPSSTRPVTADAQPTPSTSAISSITIPTHPRSIMMLLND